MTKWTEKTDNKARIIHSYAKEKMKQIRETVKREMCSATEKVSDTLSNLDWKEVGITVLALGTATVVAVVATPVILASLPAMGTAETILAGGAISGAAGGAGYSFTESCFHGKSVEQTIMDTSEAAMSGAVYGATFSALGYEASKVIGSAGPKTKPLVDKAFKNTAENADDVVNGVTNATRENAISAGKAWVGDNFNTIMDKSGNILGYSSEDGMRAFRIQYKPKEGMWRANFQENVIVNNPYPNSGQHSSLLKNVHIDILD